MDEEALSEILHEGSNQQKPSIIRLHEHVSSEEV
jgi:hypothetical protein